MNTMALMDVVYVNIYEDIDSGTVTVSHRYHQTVSTSKLAARGTCASGTRRQLARIRVPSREEQFDD